MSDVHMRHEDKSTLFGTHVYVSYMYIACTRLAQAIGDSKMSKRRDTAKKRILAECEPPIESAPAQKRSGQKNDEDERNMDDDSKDWRQWERPQNAKSSDSSKTSNADPNDGAFRTCVTQCYLKNKLSARDTTTLIRAAHKSGSQGIGDMKNVGVRHPKNESRDLRRKVFKDVDWPKPYYANIPVRCRNTGVKTSAVIPFILVHEVLLHMYAKSPRMFHKEMLEFPSGSGFAQMKQKFDKQFKFEENVPVVPIGSHGDGVPLQKEMSAEVWSWNICSRGDSDRHFFSCLEKQDMCGCGCLGRHTIAAVMEILKYCIMSLVCGVLPARRHDNEDWKKEDKERAKKANDKLPFRGNLFQIRGDWPFLKQLLSIRAWANESICWRCDCNKSTIPYWDASLTAAWRRHRFTRMVLENGFGMYPLFSIPLVTFLNICIDVLHACDLGSTQEIIGNILYESLGKYAKGKSRKNKLQDLIIKIKQHYKLMCTSNRINTLTMDMIKRDAKPPRLRAKGAETRHLVPFALEVAKANYEETKSPQDLCVVNLASSLLDFYMCLGTSPFPKKECSAAARKIVNVYTSLSTEAENHGQSAWKKKQKNHMFLELWEYQSTELGDPMTFWTYRDEDFVGLVADIGGSRGGVGRAATTPQRVVDRVRALNG